MEQPRDGFARVVAATWALLGGAGVVGVVGASALAYADTSTHPQLTAVDASDPGATTAGPTAPGQVRPHRVPGLPRRPDSVRHRRCPPRVPVCTTPVRTGHDSDNRPWTHR